MKITGRFEQDEYADRRDAPRRTLHLGVAATFPRDAEGSATVLNISATGMLIETDAELADGETFSVDLPEAGQQEASVVWADAPHYGCRFAAPLAPAALAAAQLRADAVGDTVANVSSEALGPKIHRLRKERRLSLGEIAGRLGVSKPTVWAWEHGKSNPVDRRLAALAEVLGVAVADLEPRASGSPEVIERSRREIAQAYGVEPGRIRISLDL